MLLVFKVFNRWLTFETGTVGEENEPEIDKPDDDEPAKTALGFALPETASYISEVTDEG